MLRQIATFVIITIFIGISQSGGIGGGVIINILLLLGIGLDAKTSISITYIFLIGIGLASTVSNFKAVDSKGIKVLNYDLLICTLPMMMSGAIFGTIVNHFLSQFCITLSLVILIFWLIKITYRKMDENRTAIILGSKLKLQIKAKLSRRDGDLSFGSKQNLKKQSNQLQQQDNLINLQIKNQQDKDQRHHFPIDKFVLIIQIFGYTFILLLSKGASKFHSFFDLQQCGSAAWIINIMHFIISLLFCYYFKIKILNQEMQKQLEGKENTNNFSQKVQMLMIYGFISGFLGGIASIGGGMVLVPLWLNLGLKRQMVSGSTGPLILLSASISFFIASLQGQYDSKFQIVLYLSISLIGCCFMRNLITKLANRYEIHHLMYISLLIVMGLSLVVMGPVQFWKYKQNPQQFMNFGQLC